MSKTSCIKITILLLLLISCCNTEKPIGNSKTIIKNNMNTLLLPKLVNMTQYFQSNTINNQNDSLIIHKELTILGTKLTTSNTKMIPYIDNLIHYRLTSEKFCKEDIFENPMEDKNIKVLCPIYFLFNCHRLNSFDFEPSEKFIENFNMAKSQKMEIESLGYMLEQWEEIIFEFFSALLEKDQYKINNLIKLHSANCSNDLIGFTYFKVNSLVNFGYDKSKHTKFIFDSYYQNSKEISNKIIEKDKITMLDYYYILAYVFIAEEVKEFDLCLKLCEIGLSYKLNLYLVHSVIHVLQIKDMFKESLEYFYEKTKNIVLKKIGGSFIYQHLTWHISIALLIESVRNNDSLLFDKSMSLFTSVVVTSYYLDTECYVNIFGYIIWVFSTSNGKKNLNYFLENNLISQEQLKNLNIIASNTSHLSKHSIYDYFSIWFLAQQNKKIEVDALLSKIKSNILLLNTKYSANITKDELFFYNNIYFDFCLAFKYLGEGEEEMGRSLLFKNKDYFTYNSGSTEQILILDILAHK